MSRCKELEKIDYIKTHIDSYQNIDPYREPGKIHSIKLRLFEAGLYKKDSQHGIYDSAIINLLLKAQGKVPPSRLKKSKAAKEYL